MPELTIAAAPAPTVDARWAAVAARLRRSTTNARFWIARYAAQDLGSKVVALGVGAWASAAGASHAALATGVAALEIASFYGIAFWRRRRSVARSESRRASLLRLLGEYGPAELVDLLVRPLTLGVGLAACENAALGLCVGSTLADGAFYAAAIVAARRLGVTASAERRAAH